MGASRSSRSTRNDLSRRAALCGGLAATALFAARPAAAFAIPRPRLLSFENLHTGEVLKAEYWAAGKYLAHSLDGIAHVLRDHRNDAVHAIDTRLLDALYRLQARLGAQRGFQVISGYRSPETNAKLAAESDGVAEHSLHMDGMAIDIRVPGASLEHVRDAAKSLGAGGVGYYPRSQFVHVDVGRVRYW